MTTETDSENNLEERTNKLEKNLSNLKDRMEVEIFNDKACYILLTIVSLFSICLNIFMVSNFNDKIEEMKRIENELLKSGFFVKEKVETDRIILNKDFEKIQK